MPSYEFVPFDGIAQATVEGALDVAATAAILAGIAQANETDGRHLLIDLRAASSAGLSYADVYRLVTLLSDHPAAFGGRIALLDTYQEGFEKVQFFQASATDRGFHVRSFLDQDAAIRWLGAAGPDE